MKRSGVFSKELKLIVNQGFRAFCTDLCEYFPDYFFVKPASSTGKYHPDSSNVRGGLVNHTKAAVWIAVHRMVPGALYSKFSSENQDIIIASLIFHDMVKYGNPRANAEYTDGRHPLLVRAYVESCIEKNTGKYSSEVLDMVEKMLVTIECHHGNWRNLYGSDEKLPEMQNSLHRFVHECDYLSSCKLFNFTGNR